MSSKLNTLKKLSPIVIGVVVALLIGAIIFYKARVFFLDSAYISFNILRYKQLGIQEHRWGSFITQIVPLIGQKLHLSLKSILFAYTISFNVFYLLVITLLVYRYKQYALSLLMALYYVLLFSDAYYWTNNEVFQGIAWMFLFFAVIISLGYRKVNFAVLLVPFVVLGTLAIFTHFLVMLPLAFVWICFLWDKSNWPFSRNQTILLSCLLIAIIVVKFKFSLNQSYDGEKLHSAIHFSKHDIIFAFSTPVVKEFLLRCITNYWIAVVIFIAGVISLYKDGKALLAIFTLITVFGYILIMAVTYGRMGSIFLFHIESEWTGLGIIMAYPFVFSLLPKLKPSFAIILLVSVFAIRLIYIGMSAPKFLQREKLLETVLSKMREKNISKLILINNAQIQQQMILNWAVPDESLLLSGIEHDKPQRTFIIADNEKAARDMMPDTRLMLASFETINATDFNSGPFSIDTVQSYRIMTYEELCK